MRPARRQTATGVLAVLTIVVVGAAFVAAGLVAEVEAASPQPTPTNGVSFRCPGGTLGCGPILSVPDNTATSMTIYWWTDNASTVDDVVQYGTTTGLGSSKSQTQPACEFGAPRTCHRVDLTGLTPGTDYFYQLESNGVVLQAVDASISFKTLQSVPTAPISFAVIGDWGGGGGTQLIADQVDLKDPDLLFTVGDNTPNDANVLSVWDAQGLGPYANALPRMPFFLTVGNHDMAGGDVTTWPVQSQKKIFVMPTNGADPSTDRDELWYYVSSGDALFVVVNANSTTDSGVDWSTGANQKAWLIDTLCTNPATANKKWKLVFYHQDAYCCGNGRCSGGARDGMGCSIATAATSCPDGTCSHGSTFSTITSRLKLGPIFEACGVDVAFDGHEHYWHRTRFMDDFDGYSAATDPTGLSPGIDGNATTRLGGTYYVTTGGGGTPLDGQSRYGSIGFPINQNDQSCISQGDQPPFTATGCNYNGDNDLCTYSRKYSFTYATLVNDTTLTIQGVNDVGEVFDTFVITDGSAATPSPTATTLTATPTATRTPTPTATPTLTAIATATPSATDAPTSTATTTPAPEPTPSLTAAATGTPGATPTLVPLCAPTPRAGCKTPSFAQRSTLTIKDKALDKHDALVWQWLKGSPTSTIELGAPDSTTDYAFCVYDAGPPRRLVLSANVPGGQVCGAKRPKPCWTTTKTGFRYRDSDGASDGVRSMVLQEGLEPGKARIVVVGKGAQLGVPSLVTLVPPLTVQLANSDGRCWEASYSFPARFEPSTFKAKADPTPVPRAPRPTRTPDA